MKFLEELLTKFSPIEEEKQQPVVQASPAPVVPQSQPGGTSVPVEGIEQIDPTQVMNYVGEVNDFAIPQVSLPEHNSEADKQREVAFKTDLEVLKDNYNKAQQDASRRQMYAEMIASVGNNIGNIVGGATAMNTKASVTPTKTAPINVKDQVAKVDARFNKDYDNLIKQYKELKDGGLTAKDKLYADITNANLKMAGIRTKENMKNSVGNRGMRGVTTLLNQEKSNEMSDKQLSEVSDMENTLNEIRTITGEAEKFKDRLGPNAAVYESAKEGHLGAVVPGKIDKDYVKFRSNVKALKGQYQKIISGLTLSDQERKELASYIPNEAMPYETFTASANAFESRVKDLMARKKGSMKKFQGKNVEGYKQPEASASTGPQGDVVERNGKTYKWNPAAGKYQLLVK
jgi:hypothetical protein